LHPQVTKRTSKSQQHGTLAITSGATTTANNGLNVSAGCFAVSGVCLRSGAFTSVGGYTYLYNQSDKVGIGTSTNSSKLAIEGDSGQTGYLFSVASSTIISSTSATSSQTNSSSKGYYTTIDNLGKTTMTGRVLSPRIVGEYASSTALDGAHSVAISGSYAYVANRNRDSLAIIDISNPTTPVFVSEIRDATNLDYAYHVTVSGSYAYVATNNSLAIIDISNPTNPTKVSNIQTASYAMGVAVSGGYAYVVSGSTGDDLEIFDISNPMNPSKTGGIDVSSSVEFYDIVLLGKYAYVANGEGSDDDLLIFDVSDATNPKNVGVAAGLGAGAYGIAVSGNHAYLHTTNWSNNSFFEIFDVSNPLNPVRLGSRYSRETVAGKFAVSGNYAYIFNDSIGILDISNPTNTVEVGAVKYSGNINQLVVSGSYTYFVSNSKDSLAIIDIGALDVSNVSAGNIKTDTLEVQQRAQFDSDILAHGSLNVGHNALVGGALAITGSASSTVMGSSTIGTYNRNPALTVLSGYTGLGTSTPYATLSVWGSGTNNGKRIFEVVDSASTTLFAINDYGSTTASNGINITSGCYAINGVCLPTTQAAQAFTSSAGYTTLTNANDYVGIGTSTPDSKLSVSGNTHLDSNLITFASSSATALTLRYLTNATSTITNNSSHAFTFATTTTGTPLLRLSTLTDNESLILGTDLLIGTPGNSSNLIFEENSTIHGQGANTLTFGQTGDIINFAVNTGFGSTTPYSTLSVSGTTGQTHPLFTLASSSNQKYLEVSNTGALSLTSGATTTSTNGFDLTAQGCFAVSGVCLRSGAFTSQAGYTYLYNQGDKVGIGTSTNSSKLAIEGDAGQTGYLFSVASSSLIGAYNATTTTRSSSKGYYTTIDNLGKTTVTGKVLNPTTLGNWDPNDVNIMDGTRSVTVSGSYAYVVGWFSDNLTIVDISNPMNPITVGNWDPNDTNTMDGPYSTTVSGSYAYVAGQISDNLAIIDISNPMNPITVGNWDPNDINIMDWATSVTVSGSYAYVTGYESDNLVIIDISNPMNPITVGNWDPNDTNIMDIASSVTVSGSYAYVTGDLSKTLAIVDINNPTKPTTVGYWDPNDLNIMSAASSVTVSGSYAYVTGGVSDNLAIIDISNPANPVTVGNWKPNHFSVMDTPTSVTVSGSYAYVTGSITSNLAIVDISSSTNPVTVGNWKPNVSNIMNVAYDVDVSGSYAYVAGNQSDNLAIIDIGVLEVSNVSAGNIKTDTLEVQQKAQFDSDILAHGSLNVGHNALVSGSLSVTGTASSTLMGSSTLGTYNRNPALTVLSGYTGLGTSTPYAALRYGGVVPTWVKESLKSSTLQVTTLFAINDYGSTTASNGINITNGCYAINGVCIPTTQPLHLLPR
jgi:hypothetical protein